MIDTVLGNPSDSAPETTYVKRPIKSVAESKKSKAKRKKKHVLVAAHKRRFPKTDTPGTMIDSLTGPSE